MKKSWLSKPETNHFTIHHLPFGIFKTSAKSARPGVAIGESIIDLKELVKAGFLKDWDYPNNTLSRPFLNQLMALGKKASSELRTILQNLLDENSDILQKSEHKDKIIVPMAEAEMLMPIKVRDYTDFYSSIEHATNVGKMFRDPENALLPNWKHLPVGYHGRASSIIPSGQAIHRPKGQKAPKEAGDQPGFGPSNLLDIELEMAFITCQPNKLGTSISIDEAENHIWGIALLNDWSARDIQKWEYVPLGPFLGKNFATSISCWITPLEALEPFRVKGPEQDPKPLPYLQSEGKKNYDIELEVWIETESGVRQQLAQSNFKYMYWNMCQQLAHHTINGCNVGVADVYGSGTISGKDKNSYGSLLEMTWAGKEPITLNDGSTRTFLKDGDTIILKGFCDNGSIRFGLGEVQTKVLPTI